MDPAFLELSNALLAGGEVPGLFTPEELAKELAPLDQARVDLVCALRIGCCDATEGSKGGWREGRRGVSGCALSRAGQGQRRELHGPEQHLRLLHAPRVAQPAHRRLDGPVERAVPRALREQPRAAQPLRRAVARAVEPAGQRAHRQRPVAGAHLASPCPPSHLSRAAQAQPSLLCVLCGLLRSWWPATRTSRPATSPARCGSP